MDANESLEMPVGSRRYCCQDRGTGCICDGTCLCSTKACTCKTPSVCDEDLQPWRAGQMLVDNSVGSDLLSFVPPPGRSTLPTAWRSSPILPWLTFVVGARWLFAAIKANAPKMCRDL